MDKELILSSHYFPCIAYFIYLARYKKANIDVGENYEKQSFRNRCSIYSAQGSQDLVIPLVKSYNTPIKDVNIDMRNNWKIKHWRTLCAAYNSSPFFDYYSIELKNVFFIKEKSLSAFNIMLINHICKEVGIKIKLRISDNYLNPKTNQIDLRSSLHPKRCFKHLTSYPEYTQTFKSIAGFIPNLSILDLLFNEGPESLTYIETII